MLLQIFAFNFTKKCKLRGLTSRPPWPKIIYHRKGCGCQKQMLTAVSGKVTIMLYNIYISGYIFRRSTTYTLKSPDCGSDAACLVVMRQSTNANRYCRSRSISQRYIYLFSLLKEQLLSCLYRTQSDFFCLICWANSGTRV